MGVPGLFAYCLKKFKSSNINLKSLNKSIDFLFIDGNGFIYNAVSQVLTKDLIIDENKKQDLYKLICDKTAELLNDLIKELKPLSVYLTFDGTAPLAKINQQRSRRYRTKYEDDFKQILNKKYNIETPKYTNIWSNVLITPGTEFMAYLDNYFKSEFKTLSNINFIYDGSCNDGEGEHKILNFIRHNKFDDKTIIIHGLDGDLIFLTMLINIKETLNQPNIYIYRQQTIKNSTNTINSYLDINKLKTEFIDYFQDLTKEYQIKITNNNIVDFIFICFFVGNDFLPSQKFINIYEDGIDVLIENYIKTLISYSCIININNNKIDINILAFYKFIQLCALTEYNEYKYQNETNYKSLYFKAEKLKKIYNNLYGYEKELFIFNNSISKNHYLPLLNNFDDYRFEYYKHFINSVNQQSIINNCCFEYLKMLKWNIEYYLFGPIDWQYYYGFPVAPFFHDLLNYLSTYNININEIKQNLNKPLSSNVQLLLCIPKCYLKKYIPKVYSLINYKNGYMFPNKYNVDRTDQLFLYKSIVLIPNIELNKI